ncbi:MAG: cytochrome c-type biogenesis protein CcmH [Dehalococcoidia bacterium]|nr:cytochrome c-type biogenesis protein CcmH [Dehalococcoidia bacterium]MDZ4247596.1 cytochrome c-type biogenesis protein CcmH [Dehalococcoidia bacterium]
MFFLLSPLFIACSTPAVAVEHITSELMCPCGSCELVLSECHCDRAIELTKVIQKRASKGETKEEIITFMVKQFGERVLVSKAHS